MKCTVPARPSLPRLIRACGGAAWLGAFFASPLAAHAEDPPPPATAPTAVPGAGATPSTRATPPPRKGTQRFVYDEQVVRGEVQKPEVGFIITQKEVGGGASVPLEASFIPGLLNTVDAEPF